MTSPTDRSHGDAGPIDRGRESARAPDLRASLPEVTSPARLLVTLGSAALLAGCGTEPTRPPDAAPDAPLQRVSLGLDDAMRGQLQAAIAFAGTQSRLALQQRDAADRVNAAFARLEAAIQADDLGASLRTLESARLAVRRYREIALQANDASAEADLAAMDLTLARAGELASPAPTPTTTPSQEREP